MEDGRYVTLDWDSLHRAFKRVKEIEFAMSEAREKFCRKMYLTALENYSAVELLISNAQAVFKTATEEAHWALQAKLAAKVKNNAKSTATPRVLMKDLMCGIRVSMFFKWSELDECEKPHPKCTAKQVRRDEEHWDRG